MTYKNIHYYPRNGRYWGMVIVNGKQLRTRHFDTEREAAKRLDLLLIKHKLEPINILRRIKDSRVTTHGVETNEITK